MHCRFPSPGTSRTGRQASCLTAILGWGNAVMRTLVPPPWMVSDGEKLVILARPIKESGFQWGFPILPVFATKKITSWISGLAYGVAQNLTLPRWLRLLVGEDLRLWLLALIVICVFTLGLRCQHVPIRIGRGLGQECSPCLIFLRKKFNFLMMVVELVGVCSPLVITSMATRWWFQFVMGSPEDPRGLMLATSLNGCWAIWLVRWFWVQLGPVWLGETSTPLRINWLPLKPGDVKDGVRPKNLLSPDMIWLSPEAIVLCRQVSVIRNFAEHATIAVSLEFPFRLSLVKSWPMPSRIPWHELPEDWHADVSMPQWNDDLPVDAQSGQLGAALEDGLAGKCVSQPGGDLCPQQRGRLQRAQPLLRPESSHLLRPSRPSEVQLRSDLIGGPVKLWFRQLRRIQSYVAAIAANKPTAAAVSYRLSLWESIKRASGFRGGFQHWWQHIRSWDSDGGAPLVLPLSPPALSVAEAIFSAFKTCFEQFESWHLRQRTKLLKKRYEGSMQGLFQDLRKAYSPSLDFLQEHHEFQVLAVSDSRREVCLHQDVSIAGISRWSTDEGPLEVDSVDQMVLHTKHEVDCQPADVVVQHVVHSDLVFLHGAVLDLWKKTWCAPSVLTSDLWQRVTGFCKAYVRPIGFEVEPITLRRWKSTLRRFKPTAARGVDFSPWPSPCSRLLDRTIFGLAEPNRVRWSSVALCSSFWSCSAFG